MTALPDPDPGPRDYPVFTKRGDARSELEAIAREVAGDPVTAGVHRSIYAARANQTVVLITDRNSPLAAALRARGWDEPRDAPGAARE